MGRGLGAIGYAVAQVWYDGELREGLAITWRPRMLQRTVDGQPPRPKGTAIGWLQGVPYRSLAGRPAEGGLLAVGATGAIGG
jgi:hypothetical protein